MNARITCRGTVLVMLYSGSLVNFSSPPSSSFHFVGHLEAIGTCVRIFFIVIELGGSVNIATQHKKRLPSFVAAAQEATPTFSVLMRPNHEGDTICGAGEVVVREVVVEDEKAAITTEEGVERWRRNCYHSRAAASGNPFRLLSVSLVLPLPDVSRVWPQVWLRRPTTFLRC